MYFLITKIFYKLVFIKFVNMLIRRFNINDYVKDVDDDYIFDKNGNFTGKIIERDGPHRLGMPDKNGKMQFYKFADQKHDPERVIEGIAKAIPISKNEIIFQMNKKGALSDYNRGREYKEIWFAKNSTDGEKFDYTKSYIRPTYQKYLRNPNNDAYHFDWSIENRGYQPKLDEFGFADNVFFIPEGDGYAHNTFNFGNFLWGASGRALGFSEKQVKAGANIHNKYNPRSGNFMDDDSSDDQFSIERGSRFTERNNLMNLTWSNKNKKFVPSKPIINKLEYPKYGQPKY